MFFLSISNKFPFLISFFFFSYIEALPRQYSMTMHFKNVLVLLLQQDQLPVVLVVLQAHILPTGQNMCPVGLKYATSTLVTWLKGVSPMRSLFFTFRVISLYKCKYRYINKQPLSAHILPCRGIGRALLEQECISYSFCGD